jgi:hypothetical protein
MTPATEWVLFIGGYFVIIPLLVVFTVFEVYSAWAFAKTHKELRALMLKNLLKR